MGNITKRRALELLQNRGSEKAVLLVFFQECHIHVLHVKNFRGGGIFKLKQKQQYFNIDIQTKKKGRKSLVCNVN